MHAPVMEGFVLGKNCVVGYMISIGFWARPLIGNAVLGKSEESVP
jgi:hypothetical protein